MVKLFFILGAFSAFIGIGAGAFGAHGLQKYFNKKYEPQVAEKKLGIWEKAVTYQMYHAFGLLVVAWAYTQWAGGLTTAAGWCFVAGTVFFSGSLYFLSYTGKLSLVLVTPLGGLAFMVGWLLLMLGAWRGAS